MAQAKPLNSSILDEFSVINEIDHGKERPRKNPLGADELERSPALPTSEEQMTATTNADPAAGTVIDATARPVSHRTRRLKFIIKVTIKIPFRGSELVPARFNPAN